MMRDKKICFVTTGDIAQIATAKRALGLANPLGELGWQVYIIMEDAAENRVRARMECNDSINLYYFPRGGVFAELREKSRLIEIIDPDYLYICAMVSRNMVAPWHRSKRLVEHSELQSAIEDRSLPQRFTALCGEYFSLFYASALLNASLYLQRLYERRARWLHRELPMLYFPYAYNPAVVSRVEVDFGDERFRGLEGVKCFIFLGRVVRGYGVFDLLHAAQRVVLRGYRFKLLILGRGAHYTEAQEWVMQSGLEEYISLPGFVEEDEIASYFSVASAFVSPMQDSIQDWARCPSKLYMYLPYDKPIITCRIGEPYQTLGEQGLYYTPGDHHDMADQIERAILDEESPRLVHPEAHSWQRRAEELDSWIKRINL